MIDQSTSSADVPICPDCAARPCRCPAPVRLPDDFDTLNRYLVSVTSADRVVVMNPPRGPMTRGELLGLVAWVATLATLSDDEIRAARRAIEGT